MKQNPLITVSIPVYNCEKYIERCIDSVLNQTYSNIEILLVDDRGKDKSSEIIHQVQSEFPDKIRIITLDFNQGSSVARNTGIDNALGEYLFFLDSDDTISPNCIESLYKVAIQTGATMTVGKTMAINTFNNTEYEIFPFKYTFDLIEGNDDILKYFCDGGWLVSAWNKLFNVDFFRKNNIYFIKGIYSQDELWSFHSALKLDSIAFLKEYTYYYYLHGESIIFNKKKINFENHQTIMEYFTKSYNLEKDGKRKKYILKHIIQFKELTLGMQWIYMSEDSSYWKKNYTRLKKAPSLNFFNYFSSDFSITLKKKNLFQNLPTKIGYKLFKWRFERT